MVGKLAPAGRGAIGVCRRALVAGMVGVCALIATPLAPGAPQAVAAATPHAEERVDRWHVVELGGGRAGWMRASRFPGAVDGKDTVVSESEMKFSLRRGDVGVEITLESRFEETPEGQPVSMMIRKTLGAVPVTERYRFEADHVVAITEQAGQRSESKRPALDGTWLTPAAAERYLKQRLAAGAPKIVVRSIDPTNGLAPVTITRENFEKDALTVAGREIPVFRCASSASNLPGLNNTEWIDENGVVLAAESSLGGLRMKLRSATREEALGDAGPAPEMMLTTFVTPDRPIENPRALGGASYLLRLSEGAMPELPATGSQKVEVIKPQEVRVTVKVDAAHAAPPEDAANEAYLKSSSMISATDERIRALAQKNAKGKTDADRAESLRRFVHAYIREKSLGIGFATATEVARDREGDCTEHGVLLAALLRAQKIPARVATGLIYADQFAGANRIFGYHMWTQALVEVDGVRRWVDLDATLPDAVPYDATHIALAVSTLGDGELEASMVSIIPILGRLSITVEKTEKTR